MRRFVPKWVRRPVALVLFASARAVGKLMERLFERRYGVSTRDHLYLEDLGVEAPGRVYHVPSEWICLSRALRRLDVGEDDVFCDFGSGLGNAVLVAARFPFKRVLGVEISEEMTQRARTNVDAARDRLRSKVIELHTGDASTFEISDDLTVAYFYCPFLGDPFYRLADALLDSVDRHPRPLRLLYNYPVEHNHLIDTGRFHVLDVIHGTWPPRPYAKEKRIVTYLALPQDEEKARQLIGRHKTRVSARSPWRGHPDVGFLLRKPERIGGDIVRR
jgi:hypothetical protein